MEPRDLPLPTTSPVFRTGAFLAALVLLALVSVGGSMLVGERLRSDAAAINLAGSLRMQAYRIGLRLADGGGAPLAEAVAEFEKRLASPLLQDAGRDAEEPLAAGFETIRARWRHDMRPLLAQAPPAADAYRQHVDAFVVDIDEYVQHLQRASEAKVRMLRLAQGLSVLLMLALAATTLWRLRADIRLAAEEENRKRALLMEERAIIARELHDSLAQSLSYQKIQVSRLVALLSQNGADPAVIGILDELRDGLNNAYRQLRELLTTFRLRIDVGGLEAALAATAGEFRARGLAVTLENRLPPDLLSAGEEIHVLHTLREGLANVVRHARADAATIALRRRDDGVVEARLTDNGVGMPAGLPATGHHGLAIMQERAAILGGVVSWQPATPRGTCVTLLFRPARSGQ